VRCVACSVIGHRALGVHIKCRAGFCTTSWSSHFRPNNLFVNFLSLTEKIFRVTSFVIRWIQSAT
jgi:hypothetical protein